MILFPEFLFYMVSGIVCRNRDFQETWKAEALPAITLWRSLRSEAMRGWWKWPAGCSLCLFSPDLHSSRLDWWFSDQEAPTHPPILGLGIHRSQCMELVALQSPSFFLWPHFKGRIGWATTLSWNLPFLMFRKISLWFWTLLFRPLLSQLFQHLCKASFLTRVLIP